MQRSTIMLRTRLRSFKRLLPYAKNVIVLLICLAPALVAVSTEDRIRYSFENEVVSKALVVIGEKSGCKVVFIDSSAGRLDGRTISVQNVKIRQALDACFESTAFTYAISDSVIVVKARNPAWADDYETRGRNHLFTNLFYKFFLGGMCLLILLCGIYCLRNILLSNRMVPELLTPQENLMWIVFIMLAGLFFLSAGVALTLDDVYGTWAKLGAGTTLSVVAVFMLKSAINVFIDLCTRPLCEAKIYRIIKIADSMHDPAMSDELKRKAAEMYLKSVNYRESIKYFGSTGRKRSTEVPVQG